MAVNRTLRLLTVALVAIAAAGCAAIPDTLHQPSYHNPFPQLQKVAVLPFYNQSAEPTVDGEAIAVAYYNELQAIPGFEVVPVGVSRRLLDGTGLEPRSPEEFQKLARMVGVDVVMVGTITEKLPY